ncbi:MAG TPA: SprT family zinc-dependent metalloprotease [Syntrophales bacterium]|nr:SprT family zinc-dependent metalloprotease [Syntrophales bacterium]
MTEKIIVDNIEFSVRRAERRSLAISVERNGTVTVSAPNKTDIQAIEQFIKSKGLWLRQKLAHKSETNREKIKRGFVNGQGFLYLGKSYRLKIMRNGNNGIRNVNDTSQLRLYQGYFEFPESERLTAREHFIKWYKRQTEQQLKLRISRYDKRIGVTVSNVKVSELGNRWASCGKNGTLYFNWRTVMAPIWVFDYILVHELAHMVEKGHKNNFWRLIAQAMPDYGEHIAWLQEHGVELDI